MTVRPNSCIELLDQDEFDEHQKLYSYPSDVTSRAEQAATDVMRLAKEWGFPFSEG